MVALYAVCLLAPATAFAFGNGSLAAHCLAMTDEQQALHEGHSHHHDMDRAKAGHDTDHDGLPGKCCGLFCVSAIAPVLDVVTGPVEHAPALVASPTEGLQGLRSGGIERPPRFLLSL